MTNAAVETTAASVDGQVLTVKYKSADKTEEKKVIVPPDAAIVAFRAGRQERAQSRRAGHHLRRSKQPDGTLTAPAVNVGRDGVTPPM